MHFGAPQAISEAKNHPQPLYVRRFGSYVNYDNVQCALYLSALWATTTMTASLMSFHVAPHAKSFTASFVGA